MKFKLALILFLIGALLIGIALIFNVAAVNAICYTLASLLILGAMAAAMGVRNFIVMLLVYGVLVALYALALRFAPADETPYAYYNCIKGIVL